MIEITMKIRGRAAPILKYLVGETDDQARAYIKSMEGIVSTRLSGRRLVEEIIVPISIR